MGKLFIAAALLCLGLATDLSAAAPSYGGDATYLNPGYTNNYTSGALTLGASGSGSVLIVVTSAENNPTFTTFNYGGSAMTQIGATSGGNGVTNYFNVYYIKNPASGGALNIVGTSLSPFSLMWFTYSGVDSTNPIGTTSIGNTTKIYSNAGTLQTASFNFTPSSADSTIVEYMAIADGAGNLGASYGVGFGTVRRTPVGASNSRQTGGAFGDYSPGSTATFSLSQSINPNWSTFGGILWGIELLAPAAAGSPSPTPTASPTPTNTPNYSPTFTPTASPSRTNTPVQSPTYTVTPSATRSNTPVQSPTFTPTRTPTWTPTSTWTPTRTPTATPSQTPNYSPTISPTSAPATPTQTTTPIAVPMSKSVSVGSATIGDTVTYCISWTNNSGGATDISVWDTVPIVMTYVSCWASSGSLTSCSYSPRIAYFNVGTGIANGASGTVCFRAVISRYPWLPGFDTRAWLAYLAKEDELPGYLFQKNQEGVRP